MARKSSSRYNSLDVCNFKLSCLVVRKRHLNVYYLAWVQPMETVLVIEDSRPMQRTLKRLFESDALQVRIASDGTEGLESFRQQPPAVVVLDLKLPGLSGKELCRSFKSELPG